ncbi:MAG: LuxR C-terminal-related transcriptional regulator [Geminicoccales bacterium]
MKGIDHDVIAEPGEAGGWRMFMREATEPIDTIAPIRDDETIAAFPNTVLGRAFLMAKCGHVAAAKRQLEAFRDAIQDDMPSALASEFALVETHVRVYADEALGPSQERRLLAVLETLPDEDAIGQALANNHLSTVALHRGEFDKAQDYAETAIRLFRQDGAEFGSLHLHTHLGQIRLMRGDLTGAERQFREMEDRLNQLSGESNRLRAVGRVLRSEVAYEMNDLPLSRNLLEGAMGSVEESDAWLDVLAAAYRVSTRLALSEAGLPGALTALSHGEQVARRRAMPRLLRLMQIERVRALTLCDELDEARAEMVRIGLTPDHPDPDMAKDWALRHGSSLVAQARWMMRARRARVALEFLGPAEDFAIRGGQLLVLAKLRVIRALAHWRLKARAEATSSLLSSIRLLGRQPFRRFVLDEGPDALAIVQAALDGDHVTIPPAPEQRRRLAELTHYWAVRSSTSKAGTASGLERTQNASGEALRRRYLELLAHGHSNKEIGRTMGVSANTVKYHLKQIFRELRVDNRSRAVRRARELGIIE